MKKIILLVSAMAIALNAHAQFTGSSSRSSFGGAGSSESFSCYVKAGLSLNSCTLSGSLYDQAKSQASITSGSVTGYNAVFGCRLFERQGLYYGMEAGVGTRGMNLSTVELSSGIADNILVRLHGLKASPVILGYSLDFNDFIALDAHIGAFLSYDFAGKGISTSTYSGSVQTSTSDLNDMDAMNRFDVGIHPGITLWIGSVGIDFAYQLGFISLVESPVTSGYDMNYGARNIILGVAYRFM